jgi:Xaa-Pro aminopeptidase
MKELNRLYKFQEFLKKSSCDLFLVEDSVNLYYMTGLSLSAGLLLAQQDSAFLLVDSRYYELCKKNSPFPVLLSDKISLTSLLKSDDFSHVQTVGFDAENMTYSKFQELENLIKELRSCALTPFDNPLKKIRMIKEPEELERLREAATLGAQGYDYACSLLKQGITEEQIAIELEIFWKRRGGKATAFDPIIAFGDHSAMPHYRAGSRPLQKGMTVLIDIGVTLDHYHSDMTRVVFFGEPEPKMLEIYQIVKTIQQKAVDACRPGLRIGELDQLARGYIESLGYGDYFKHGLGHGIGLEVHEAPIIRNKAPYKDVTLEPGMVITIEPGIYLPGIGGVRIEDTLVINQKDHENLTNRTKELTLI